VERAVLYVVDVAGRRPLTLELALDDGHGAPPAWYDLDRSRVLCSVRDGPDAERLLAAALQAAGLTMEWIRVDVHQAELAGDRELVHLGSGWQGPGRATTTTASC